MERESLSERRERERESTILHLRSTGAFALVGIFVFGLLHNIAEDTGMAKAVALPSLAAFNALSVTTFEGASVPASSLYTPVGSVIYMIRRMG